RMTLVPVSHGAIEVLHERREIVERVRIFVASQTLAIAGHAGLQRIASTDEDARAGQHRADRSDVEPIVGQLIREAGSTRAPIRRAVQILLTEALPVVRVRRRRPLLQRLTAATRLLGEYARQIGQLARTLDLRV